MVQKMRALLGLDNSKDALLQQLLNRAEKYAQAFTHISDIPEDLVISIAIEDYERLGSEVYSTEHYSDISYTYNNTYSEPVMSQLRSIRRVRVI